MPELLGRDAQATEMQNDPLIIIEGDEQSRLDPALPDGGLPPYPGVQSYQVFRASRDVPELTLQGKQHTLKPGGYAFIPPGADWTLHNVSDAAVRFHWVRKHYQVVDGIPLPEAFVTNEQDVEPIPMPGTNGAWVTTRFVDMSDMRHDMHVNIVTFEPGGVIPFAETHVMEHGLYVLEGKAVYRLNQDWVEVEAGDFMWLRAFCPQACYSGGPGRFRYLLYKDVIRHMNLTLNPAR